MEDIDSVFFLGSGMDGCITYGDDIEDARRNAREALEAYLRYKNRRRYRSPVPWYNRICRRRTATGFTRQTSRGR